MGLAVPVVLMVAMLVLERFERLVLRPAPPRVLPLPAGPWPVVPEQRQPVDVTDARAVDVAGVLTAAV